jgi:hypothetical protein
MFFYPRKPSNIQHLVGSQNGTHKILWLTGKLASFGGIAICLGMFGFLQAQKARFILLPDGVHFVDADCYSRMTRARMISAAPGTLVTRHAFENYPNGVRPHTTAPMDYLIIGFSWLLGARADLDIAGAWISPVLGAILILLAGLWAEAKAIPYRWSMMVLLSTSPVILHGFAVGRPDHQSLIILLIASGLMAEAVLWTNRSTATSLWWGFSWGCSLWVSWFEPLLILALVLIVRLLVWRSQSLAKSWAPSGAVAAMVVVLAILLEGLPSVGLEGNPMSSFLHWAGRIGELQAFNPLSAAIAWIGWLSPLAPFGLAWIAYKRKERIGWLWLALLLSMGALTGWHARWGYFLAVSGALAVPFVLSIVRQRWFGYTLFAASLWPVALTLENELFPQGKTAQDMVDNLRESQQLRVAASVIKGRNGDGILAPWWLTPQLVYWSGKNGVAGSSHESLAGTLDSARFFTSQNEEEAKSILRTRQVDFVVVCDADRLLDNSYTVLGRTGEPSDQLAITLFRTPSRSPNYLHLVSQNPYFKVYQVDKEMLE